MSADFLLELRCEEIPARMQAGARAELEKLFRREMEAEAVTFEDLTVWSTPRRLALIARGLPNETKDSKTEVKGPRVGAPDQAMDGFLRRYEAKREQLFERNGIYFLEQLAAGRPMTRVLQEAIPIIIRDFAWPKSMRWGTASLSTESLRWVRPLSGIVAILGDDLVDFEIDGIESGYATLGHRFHSPRPITIGGAADYQEKLRACHVIVDHEERAALIRDGARKVAEEAGLTLVEDEGLVVENAGLTEWPVPLLGRFDEAFLDVPPEVIQLTARVNQKYFVCEDADGKLANAFICTANITAQDPAVVVDGNRKVLAARLADARFFWEQDRKTTLAEHAEKLERITFHEKLGTVADKVERVAKLARWLVDADIVKPLEDTPQAKTMLFNNVQDAAMLCKADLVTEMVGEFPELQGLMGGYYARAEGLPVEVSDAIRDHYKPVGQGDEVPTAPVTVAVSLADKLDTLVGFFASDEKPTGSKDPFALRRQTLGIIGLILKNGLRMPLGAVIGRHDFLVTYSSYKAGKGVGEGALNDLYDFFADRLKVQQREAGVRHDLIDAVFALGNEDDLVRLLARVHALQSFIGTGDGTNLLAGYKRAANILKKEGWTPSVTPAKAGVHSSGSAEGAMDSGLRRNDDIARTGDEDPLENVDDPQMREIYAELSHTPEPAEAALIEALEAAEPRAIAAIKAEDFAAAMSALASLRAPIDRFFDEVTVNAPQESVRASRLNLLARFRAAVHKVADFSRIEG